MPRGRRKNYVPCWGKKCNTLCHSFTRAQRGLTLIEKLRPYYLDSGRRSRSDGRKLSTSSTSRTLAARHGEPSTNLLAGLDAPFASAQSRKTPSPRNLRRTGHTGPGIVKSTRLVNKELSDFFQHLRATVSLNPLGRRTLLLPSDARSQESLQDWIPFFRSSYSTPSRLSNLDFVTSSLRACANSKFPKIWRRALIVAIRKPEKSLGDPNSYRPISLLCVTFKILEDSSTLLSNQSSTHFSQRSRRAFDTRGRP